MRMYKVANSRLYRLLGKVFSAMQYQRDRLRLGKLMGQGLKVGRNVYIMEDVEFDCNYPYLIEIGDNCRISKGVRILSHDATTFRELGVTRLAPVRILEGTFIGEKAIILPGVTIGPNALIAAGSVVNRDIGEDLAAAGNPARPYSRYSELLERYRARSGDAHVFTRSDLDAGKLSRDTIAEVVVRKDLAFMRGIPVEDPYYVHTDIHELRRHADAVFKKVFQRVEEE